MKRSARVDAFIDRRLVSLAGFPIDQAKGRPVVIKIAALALAPLWVIPVFIVAVFPAVLLSLALQVWEEMD